MNQSAHTLINCNFPCPHPERDETILKCEISFQPFIRWKNSMVNLYLRAKIKKNDQQNVYNDQA